MYSIMTGRCTFANWRCNENESASFRFRSGEMGLRRIGAALKTAAPSCERFFRHGDNGVCDRSYRYIIPEWHRPYIFLRFSCLHAPGWGPMGWVGGARLTGDRWTIRFCSLRRRRITYFNYTCSTRRNPTIFRRLHVPLLLIRPQ